MTTTPQQFSGRRTDGFSINNAGSNGKEKKLGPHLKPYTKVHSRWIIYVKLKSKTTKLVEENTRNVFRTPGEATVS